LDSSISSIEKIAPLVSISLRRCQKGWWERSSSSWWAGQNSEP